jgi:hypothetical protein
MLVLHPIALMNLLQLVITTQFQLRKTTGTLPEPLCKEIHKSANAVGDLAEGLELPVTAKTARIMFAKADTSKKLRRALMQLGDTLFMELDSMKFYGPLERYIKYFEQQQLFGIEVFNGFSSSNDDIYEAGTCLALERATAHLNRALECGLAALAKAVSVPKQNDWGRYIQKIGEELDSRAKAAGTRSPDEQFYAEGAANFDRLRRAYRNPTMHPEKTYSQDCAEEILLATKSFMAHLATRISE